MYNLICNPFFLYFSIHVFVVIFKQKARKSSPHPQTIIKLNPMNSPRTPPHSARKELNGYASSSLRTRMLSLTNMGHSKVEPFIPVFMWPSSCNFA